MEEHQVFKLQLPKSKSTQLEWVTIESDGPIVIVGGNGSGKTRLGALLDTKSPQYGLIHRVAAQRALSMPEICSPISNDDALASLRYGYHKGNPDYKIGYRWQSKPETILLDDYERLMVYLFGESWEVSEKYRQEAKSSEQRIEPTETKLDIVKRIWEATLPYRSLHIRAGKIEASPCSKGAAHYAGMQMSDGERVIIYLIGQVLSVPQDGIVIIDEPEIHLHKAIQARLWDNIEAERPDCLFVYLTHDIDFAASRVNAKKLCFHDYDGSTWDWFEIPDDSSLPEEILLQIVGSRKPVLFVEGEMTSLDFRVFQHVYPNYSVIPCGSCENVIHSTASFTSQKELHRLECCGIIDRDLRSEAEVQCLVERDVYVLPVAEIENLFLTEDVLNVVAIRLAITGREEIEAAKKQVLELLEKEKDQVVSTIVCREIERKLRNLNSKITGILAVKSSVDALFGDIDISALYQNVEERVSSIIKDKDYAEAIKIFSNKGLLPAIASIFGMKAQEFSNYFIRLISSKCNADIIQALKKHLPELS